MKTLPVSCKQCGIIFQKSCAEINRMEQIGYKNHFCSNKCSRSHNQNLWKNILPLQRKEEYYKNPKKCILCEKIIPYEKKKNVYCSHQCGSLYTQKDGGNHHWSDENKKKMSEWGKKYAYKVPRTGIEKVCDICKQVFYVQKSSKKICCSRDCTTKWINKTGYMKGKTGGYRPHSGTSKKGWYKGIFCGSSWELAWVIYYLEHNIPFRRNNAGFPYEYSGKTKKYYPDFYLIDDNKYIEIKNYYTAEVGAKTTQFPHKLDVLYEMDLRGVFEYVIQKYGKDYIRLYEPKKSS
jgi:hypothetical protein